MGIKELQKNDLSKINYEEDDEFDASSLYAHEENDEFDQQLEDLARINMLRTKMKRQRKARRDQQNN
ncbi:hypothetical protein [Methyloversatilis sp.]|uniref:hypothetical protein n=1 Tax=Methyloversatilis sp. TaxID=2569862 RepID=UPI0035B214DD